MIFTHPLLQEEVFSIAGYYEVVKEEVMPHQGGEILYFVGFAKLDSSCCGQRGCGYAVVAGFVEELRCGTAEDGRPTSRVRPVPENLYNEVCSLIRTKEGVSQVHFLLASGDKKVMF